MQMKSFQAAVLALATAGFAATATPALAAPAFDHAPVHVAATHEGDTWNHGKDRGRHRGWDRSRGRDRDYYRDGYRSQNYYGDRYNRDRYEPRQVWRGYDGRTYCRRDDGTTGLLLGAVVGGVVGNEVAGQGDRTLGTVIGAVGGGLLGRSIDRSGSRCR